MMMDDVKFIFLSICFILLVFSVILILVGKEFLELTNVIYHLKEKVNTLEMIIFSKQKK